MVSSTVIMPLLANGRDGHQRHLPIHTSSHHTSFLVHSTSVRQQRSDSHVASRLMSHVDRLDLLSHPWMDIDPVGPLSGLTISSGAARAAPAAAPPSSV